MCYGWQACLFRYDSHVQAMVLSVFFFLFKSDCAIQEERAAVR